MSKKRVLICGSGPSAALAVLAAADCGAEYRVISATDPTLRPAGAFFLHWLPPSLHQLPVEVVISGQGTKEQYCWKQWGCGYDSSFPRQQHAENWYAAEALSEVWKCTPVEIAKLDRPGLLRASAQYDWIFHTFPVFDNAAVKIPVHVTYEVVPDRPEIVYNGLKDIPWCRQTRAFGEVHEEYAHTFEPDPGDPGWTWVQDLPPWTSPVTARLAPNIIPIGRMARQESKYLAHHAYEEVVKCLTA